MSYGGSRARDMRELRNTTRDLSDGLSISRQATGQVLEVCQQLTELKRAHPSLEIRGLDDGYGNAGPLFGIQELKHSEISRRAPQIGHVPVRKVLKRIFNEIPSLDDELPVEKTWVDTRTDRSGATYVSLVPNALDLLKLARERHQELRIIEALAGSKVLNWRAGYFDLTVAYIPGHAADGAVDATIDFLESRDPISMTLLPAEF